MSAAPCVAVDTATLTQSVAVLCGAEVRAERALKRRRGRGEGHSGSLLSAIHGALEESGYRVTDVGLFVAGLGPGSFTGLRIGLSCLKGLAFANATPLVGVSSLRAMAVGAGSPGLVVPVIDARKREVYAAIYRDGIAVMHDCAADPNTLRDRVEAHRLAGEPVTLLGEGLSSYGDVFAGLGRQLGPAFVAPRASIVGALGQAAAAESIPPLASVEPNYQRASDAERNLAAKAQR